GEEVLEVIFLARLHSAYASGIATLTLEGIQRNSFDIALLGDKDGHGVVGHQVLGRQLVGTAFDAAAALVSVFVANGYELFFDQIEYQLPVGQQALVLGNFLSELGIFLFDLAAFQSGQSAQLHFQDGIGLGLVEIELSHQTFASLL